MLNEKIKVVVVDDQRFARMYVDMYVKTSTRYELTASLPFAEDLFPYLENHTPDIIIIDVVMEKGINGLAAAIKVKKLYPDIKIILATSMAESGWMEQAKAGGIESFWYKEYSKMSLLEIMDRTADGERVYSDDAPETYLGLISSGELTVKQKIILGYLIEGLTNKEIAEKMKLSVNTVKSYLDDIMEMSGIHSRTELAVKASRLELNII